MSFTSNQLVALDQEVWGCQWLLQLVISFVGLWLACAALLGMVCSQTAPPELPPNRPLHLPISFVKEMGRRGGRWARVVPHSRMHKALQSYLFPLAAFPQWTLYVKSLCKLWLLCVTHLIYTYTFSKVLLNMYTFFIAHFFDPQKAFILSDSLCSHSYAKFTVVSLLT